MTDTTLQATTTPVSEETVTTLALGEELTTEALGEEQPSTTTYGEESVSAHGPEQSGRGPFGAF